MGLGLLKSILITGCGFAEILGEDKNARLRFVTGSDAMQKIRRVELVGCAVLLALVFPGAGEAYGGIVVAYIDPGTGSLIIQILLAILVGAGFAIKIFWTKIKTFFSKVFAKKRDDSDK
jgi:hypothetical protein